MPRVISSWNSIFNAPRILEGAISERKTGTACLHQNNISDFQKPIVITSVNFKLLIKYLINWIRPKSCIICSIQYYL